MITFYLYSCSSTLYRLAIDSCMYKCRSMLAVFERTGFSEAHELVLSRARVAPPMIEMTASVWLHPVLPSIAVRRSKRDGKTYRISPTRLAGRPILPCRDGGVKRPQPNQRASRATRTIFRQRLSSFLPLHFVRHIEPRLLYFVHVCQ
jgi:hypothetical protein